MSRASLPTAIAACIIAWASCVVAFGAAPAGAQALDCAAYRETMRQGIVDIRYRARAYRSHKQAFANLKRRRANDGVWGPDIALNVVLVTEQKSVTTEVVAIVRAVAAARRLACAPRYRLNLVENEAARIDHDMAADMLWIDPRTFH